MASVLLISDLSTSSHRSSNRPSDTTCEVDDDRRVGGGNSEYRGKENE